MKNISSVSLLFAIILNLVFCNKTSRVEELATQFKEAEFPDSVSAGYVFKIENTIDLKLHDYLLPAIDSLTKQVAGKLFSQLSGYSLHPVFYTIPQPEFYALVYYQTNPEEEINDYYGLVTVSKNDKVVDFMLVNRTEGYDGSGVSIETIFTSFNEFFVKSTIYEEDSIIKIEEKYSIDQNGEIKSIEKKEFKIEGGTVPEYNAGDYIEGGSDLKCYRFESKVQTVTFSLYFFDKGIVHGTMFKDIHDEENAYNESFMFEFDGYIKGIDLNVKGKDSEDDEAITEEKFWTIYGDSIKIDDGIILKLIDCELNKRPHEQD